MTDAATPRPVTATTPHGTFTRKTARECTVVAVWRRDGKTWATWHRTAAYVPKRSRYEGVGPKVDMLGIFPVDPT